MDSVSEQRLALIYPPLADKIRQMANTLAAEGIEIRVVQGLRTVAEQDALYAKGRTTPPIGKKYEVTNCPGGFSYHGFGLATDCVPSIYGPDQPYNPDWNKTHPDWQKMEAIGKSLGLDCGALWRTFKDAPHFQYTGGYPEGEPSLGCRELLANSGMQAVWDAVTEYYAAATG